MAYGRTACISAAMVLSASALLGCTKIESIAGLSEAPNTVVPAGVTYLLPETALDFTVSHRLVQCQGPNVEFETLGTITAEHVPGEPVTLVYDSISSITKVTQFKAQFHDNLMLKTVNATAEDKTGEIIKKLAETASNVVRFVAVSGGLGVANARSIECSQAAKNQIAKIAEQKKSFDASEAELKDWTAKLKERKKVPEPAEPAAKEKWAAAIQEAEKKIEAATKAMEETGKVLKALKADLTLSVSERVIPDAANAAFDVRIAPTESMLQRYADRWLMVKDNAGVPPTCVTPPAGQKPDPITYLSACFIAAGNGQIFAQPEGVVTCQHSGAGKSCVRRIGDGIVYRQPGRARVTLCKDVANADDCRKTAGENVLAKWSGSVAQFGNYAVLPFENGPFENNALSATFREDGALVDFTHDVKSAAGLVAADSLLESSKQLQLLQDNIIKSRKAQLESERDNLKLQKEIDDSRRQLEDARRAEEAKESAK